MVKFVSYDGKYPNLCSGTLILNIDGEDIIFPNYCLRSGGSAGFTSDWKEVVTQGEWSVDVPEQYKHLSQEIENVVNLNVPYGCCGGCI